MGKSTQSFTIAKCQCICLSASCTSSWENYIGLVDQQNNDNKPKFQVWHI